MPDVSQSKPSKRFEIWEGFPALPKKQRWANLASLMMFIQNCLKFDNLFSIVDLESFGNKKKTIQPEKENTFLYEKKEDTRIRK